MYVDTISRGYFTVPQTHKEEVKSQPIGDVRQELLALISGRRVLMPDLQALFDDWDHGTNKHSDRLREETDRHLRRFFTPGKRLNSLLAADFGGFASMWWPDAEYEELKISAWLGIWLFAWDDETDSKAFSNILDDDERSEKMRNDTLAWCKYTLGLDNAHVEPPTSPLIRSFDEVGQVMRAQCSTEMCWQLYREIEFFIQMSEVEQRVSRSGSLPTVDQYRRTRMGTSAVEVCLAMTEYQYQMELPSKMMKSESMKSLWAATNVIVATVNDMLSAHKEIANNQIDSLIPLLTHDLGSLQPAIDRATDQVKWAISLFEKSVEDLESKFQNDSDFHNLRLMIRGCRTACTGNLNWSLVTQRYSIGVTSLRGGAVVTI